MRKLIKHFWSWLSNPWHGVVGPHFPNDFEDVE